MGIRNAIFQPVDAFRHQGEPVTPVEEFEEEEYLEEQPIEYSGFVIVRLVEGEGDDQSRLPVGDSLRAEAEQRGFHELVRVLEQFEIDGRRLIQELSPEEIDAFENPDNPDEQSFAEERDREESQVSGSQEGATTLDETPIQDELLSVEPPSLNLYWRIDVRDDPARADRLLAALARLGQSGGVGLVYREMKVAPAQFPLPTDPIFAQQRYLHPAPDGIDIWAAWALFAPGQTVNNVGFADVEEGWFRGHADLPGWLPNVALSAGTDNPLEARHGVSVLGILMANQNAVGIFGQTAGLLRNQLRLASNFHNGHNNNVAAAIVGAARGQTRGDVLLIEVERSGRPVELDCADFAAIYRAGRRGIIVVEAAGNGHVDLDAAYVNYRCRVGMAAGLQQDSGAIIVGACNPRVRQADGQTGHSRLSDSSYGQRVDCHAWGSSVLTTDDTGSVWLFDGTSAAAAIIAGAVVVLQSLYKARNPGQRIAPSTMRAALRDPANGTPQVPLSNQRIGSMPDLARVLPALGL